MLCEIQSIEVVDSLSCNFSQFIDLKNIIRGEYSDEGRVFGI